MTAGAHPRILFSFDEWEKMTTKYAAERDTPDRWYKAFLDYTENKGPGNDQLYDWSLIDTSAYTGKADMNKTALAILAKEVELMGEYHEGGMFMCALHATVNEKYEYFNGKEYLPEGQGFPMAINVIVNFAKIVLSHYATYGCVGCEYRSGIMYSDLWNPFRSWGIQNDWLTGGLGIALSYDVLYDRFTEEQRRFIRSAIAIMVTARQHWGITDVSNRMSPNAVLHPNRIFSNWATYHANLFLTNLAIEGESDFDDMTSGLTIDGQSPGFDWKIHDRSIALYDAFMKHSVYPEGSTFEDGYVYSLAFREGSLAFIALAKRGINLIDTPRFRNLIYNSAQMHEPFRCGHFIGHSSGGGALYPASYALFRYSYPDSELAQMMWAQRMGLDFKSYPCRIWWHQVMMQMGIMGMDHPEDMEHNSQEGLPTALKQHYHLSMYQPRRGVLVARTDLTDSALYFHFDARPDAFVVGHDNADRGVITLSSHGRTWLDELPWREYYTSQHHSIMHIDGQAQALKAPSVRMLKVSDTDNVVLAAADLTYAYNVQWARAWSSENEPLVRNEVDFVDGEPVTRNILYITKETGGPLDYGWPQGDDTSDIGITSSTKMFGEDHIGFAGIYTWKRKYRQVSLLHAVRSTALIRSSPGLSYVMVGDNYAMTGSENHSFEMYLILAPGVKLSSTSSCTTQPCACITNPCMINLEGGSNRFMTIHASTIGNQVEYRHEPIDDTGSSRLIIKSGGQNFEKFCTVLHPHEGTEGSSQLKVRRGDADICSVYEVGATTEREFRFQETNHTLESFTVPYVDPNVTPSPSPSISLSSTPSPSSTPSKRASPSVSPTPSASSAPSLSSSPSATSTPSNTPTPTPSYTPSASNTPSVSSTPSVSITPTRSPTPHATASPLPKQSASPSTIPDELPEWAPPSDPHPLRKWKRIDFFQDDLNFERPTFFNTTSRYEAELTLVVDAANTPKRRTIKTCFPETTAVTFITLWNCGASNVAEDNYYYRECTQIPNDYSRTKRNGVVTTVRPRKCKDKDILKFDEEKGAKYFIVIGVDDLNGQFMDLTVRYG